MKLILLSDAQFDKIATSLAQTATPVEWYCMVAQEVHDLLATFERYVQEHDGGGFDSVYDVPEVDTAGGPLLDHEPLSICDAGPGPELVSVPKGVSSGIPIQINLAIDGRRIAEVLLPYLGQAMRNHVGK